jgi:roadblock/LC7 domain-containing protein
VLAASASAASSAPVVVAFALPGQSVRFVDSSGKEIGAARLPQPPQYAASTTVPGRAIVVGQNGGVAIVDARSSKVIPVRVPTGNAVLSSSFTRARRYVVLGSPGVASALLDVQTGKTQPLTSAPGLAAGTFSPDGSTLLAIGSKAWLVPAANPAKAVSLPSHWVGGSFSPDGRTVAFVDFADKQHHRVAVTNVDGGGHREFDPGVPGLGLVRFLPDGRLLLVGASEVAVVGSDGKDRHQIGTVQGLALSAVVDPGGRGALVGAATAGSNNADRWTWVDLRGASHRVAALDGLTPLPAAVGGRYAYLVDDPAPGPGSRRVVVVDLGSGVAHTALRTPASSQFIGTDVASYGRGLLVSSLTGNTARLSLVKPSGPARVVASAAVVGGRFSPDGSWIAVSERASGKKPGKLQLVPLGGGAAVNAGTGDAPVWVP